MAGATFFRHPELWSQSGDIQLQDAHRLLFRVLGTQWAPILFAVALLAAGQSSTLTGTLAGQVVMEGAPDEIVNDADVRRVYLGDRFSR